MEAQNYQEAFLKRLQKYKELEMLMLMTEMNGYNQPSFVLSSQQHLHF